MTATPEVKRAYVYRAVIKDAHGRRPVEVNWAALLAKYENYSMAERTHDDVVYFLTSTEDGQIMLSMHEPLSTDYLTNLSSQSGTVADLLPDDERDASEDRVARSTAVLPVGRQGHFAYARGVNHAPSHTRVRDLLKIEFPLNEGEHWEVEAIMDTGALKQFEAADGITAFHSKVFVQHDLLNMMPTRKGVFRPLTKIARWLESDVEIEVTFRLPASASAHRGKRRELQRLTRNNLPEMLSKTSGAKATVVHQNGQSEVLDLVEHKLVMGFEIPAVQTERRSFTTLCEGLLAIVSEVEATLNSLTGTDVSQPVPISD